MPVPLSNTDMAKAHAGQGAAPAASYAQTLNIDAPTNTKNASWGGARGTYGPNLAGPGITPLIALYFAS